MGVVGGRWSAATSVVQWLMEGRGGGHSLATKYTIPNLRHQNLFWRCLFLAGLCSAVAVPVLEYMHHAPGATRPLLDCILKCI